jgi:plastocyanin
MPLFTCLELKANGCKSSDKLSSPSHKSNFEMCSASLSLTTFIQTKKNIFIMKPNYTRLSLQKILFTLLFFAGAVMANATTQTVNVQNFSFTPSSFSINLGDTVKWVWVNGGHTTSSTTIPAGAAIWDHAINSSPGNTSFVYVPSVSGTYNYRCNIHFTTMLASFTVICNPPTSAQAMINAGGPTTFCKGANVVLTVATSGLSYQWKKGSTIQTGATNQSFTASKSGNYKCDVSNSCGTTTSNSISVTQNASPTAFVSQAPCSGGAVLLTCNFTPASGVTFKWKKGNATIIGATNSTFSATQSATYKCTVTITATGCSKTSAGSSVTITCKLDDAVNTNKVVVYPNPTSDYFNINTAQLDPQSVIYIYDLTGRLLESHDVSSGEIKVGGTLSNGVYFLKIAANGETRQVIKLVKNF